MDLLAATTNDYKLKEIRHILKIPVEGVSLKVREDGRTFEENAVKKAKAAAKKFKRPALADDSGLTVDFLNGAPGVRSARFATPPTPINLCTKLLKKLKNTKNRKAQFVCVIAVVWPDGKVRTFKGIVRGKIAGEMRGGHGFGYDPVFIPDGYQKTFAEMTAAQKNRISHRGRALKKLKAARLSV